jgi:acetyl-CoA synthetase
MYDRSLQDSDGFWAEQARSLLSWFRDFDHVQQGSFNVGDIAWFTGGKVRLVSFRLSLFHTMLEDCNRLQ